MGLRTGWAKPPGKTEKSPVRPFFGQTHHLGFAGRQDAKPALAAPPFPIICSKLTNQAEKSMNPILDLIFDFN
jgi:hypothetical protein